MQVVVYFKNCDCLKYIKNTPTCFGSRRIHRQGVIKQYLTKIICNCSTVRVMRFQCLAAYLTCTECVCILHRLEVLIQLPFNYILYNRGLIDWKLVYILLRPQGLASVYGWASRVLEPGAELHFNYMI
jgi:hypothetical protein